jgi:hypothetical protein
MRAAIGSKNSCSRRIHLPLNRRQVMRAVPTHKIQIHLETAYLVIVNRFGLRVDLLRMGREFQAGALTKIAAFVGR